MNSWRTAIAVSLATATLAASPAWAQGKGKQAQPEDKCKIDLSNPGEVKDAYNSLTVLQLTTKPEDRQKKLRGAVTSLTKDPDKIKNVAGRDFVLGEALVLWSQQPGAAAVMKRGDLGYATDPNGTVDVLAAADSAFRVVEQQLPDCASKTEIYRRQAWAPIVNQVGPLVNGDNTDSAQKVLDRAFAIYQGHPFGWYLKGQLAYKKGDFAEAAKDYQQAAKLATPELLSEDSNMVAVKEFSTAMAGQSALQAAAKANGAEQKQLASQAAEAFRQYLQEYPNGENAGSARAGLTQALQASGDTASLGSVWQQMVADPSKYNEEQLFNQGVQAYLANNYDVATKLMEAGQQQNPWLRQGLFNLANVYWKTEQWDKMLPVTHRLIQIDPNNPDDYQLMGIAFQGKAKATKDPKVQKAYNDSLNTYLTAGEKLPVKLTFKEFTHDDAGAKLTGTAENMGATQKNATLKVEFLDHQGNVVGTATTPITLGPKGKADFTVSATGKGIAAYRYGRVA